MPIETRRPPGILMRKRLLALLEAHGGEAVGGLENEADAIDRARPGSPGRAQLALSI